ncbi:MAG: hypothetical protein AAF533_15315 [Acidobacteriota bacterium]
MRLTFFSPIHGLVLALLVAVTSPDVAAQGRGDYYNVETPQVNPIDLFQIGGHWYLVVVNTPDNSVEFYQTDETLPPDARFLQRVPTGLEPGSVCVSLEHERVVVTNFLGDSLTAIHVAAPTGPSSFVATLVATVPVTDEPMDCEFVEIPDSDDGALTPAIMVTHGNLDALGTYHQLTMQPLAPGSERRDAVLSSGQDLDFDGMIDDIALKQPWTLDTCELAGGGQRLVVLGHLGGNTPNYDFDLYFEDLGGGNEAALAGLGSSNWNMTFGADGTLYVVGNEAQNADNFDEAAVAAEPTGFVKSMFYAIEDPCSDNPTVHRRDVNLERRTIIQVPREPFPLPGGAIPGQATIPAGDSLPAGPRGLSAGSDADPLEGRSPLRRRSARRGGGDDAQLAAPSEGGFSEGLRAMGLEPGEGEIISDVLSDHEPDGFVIGNPTPLPLIGPVDCDEGLSQLTDVAVFERPGATWPKVFFTANSNDAVGVLVPRLGQNPNNWPRRHVDLGPSLDPESDIRGPRGVVIRPSGESDVDDGGRAYVSCRFDNSVAIVNTSTETVVGNFRLASHPVPDWIKKGREPLYNAKRSGNCFVSCSSCHLDARTDGLAWQLSDNVPVPIPDEINSTGVPEWPGNKGFMVTQSLQGLLNWEVHPDIQGLYTNAPYHWRGDRATFVSFAPAFEGLLLGPPISDEDMEEYEEFINSVHYPPNPKQLDERMPSGDVGDPLDGDDAAGVADLSGSGAAKGLKVFCTLNSDGDGGCRNCHELPEGSNNILTENIAGLDPFPPPLAQGAAQPIETAALRHLFQKEARLDRDGASAPRDSPITGLEGLMHTGLLLGSNPSNDAHAVASMNAFNLHFFDGRFCINRGLPNFCDNMVALNQALQEWDTGTGPLVGRAVTVTRLNAPSIPIGQALSLAEKQANLANAGLAVRGRINGVQRGWFYDTAMLAPIYREEPGGGTFTRAQLLNLLLGTRDVLVFTSVPLGSERRVGHPNGNPTTLNGSGLTGVAMLPMLTNTHHADIPSFGDIRWVPPNGVNQFNHFTHTVRVYQNAILDDGPADGWGLCSVRHEAPRRFSVVGKGIRHGATLHLFSPAIRTLGPPNPALPPDDPSQPPLTEIVLPLHGTDRMVGDAPVFETAEELEPLLFYGLMAGPPNIPGLLDRVTNLDRFAVINPESQPGTFNPLAWNLHYLRVQNADGTTADGGWVPITIEPGPDCP